MVLADGQMLRKGRRSCYVSMLIALSSTRQAETPRLDSLPRGRRPLARKAYGDGMNTVQYDTLVRSIYEGVLATSGWQRVLKELRSLTNSEENVLLLMDRNTGAVLVGETYNVDPSQVADYEANYASDDPGRMFIDKIDVGQWYFDVRELGSHTIASHDFYQDFLRRHDLGSIMWTPLLRSGLAHAALSFLSGAGRAPFQIEDTEFVKPLLPHLATAAMLRWRFQEVSRLAWFGQQLLDRLQCPLMIVDSGAHILFANAAAGSWLSDASHPFAHDAVTRLGASRLELLRLARQICGTSPVPVASMKLGAGSPGGTTYLVGLPLREDHPAAQSWSQPVGMVVVYGPSTRQAPWVELLRQMFLLTPAECRLVEKLSDTHSLTGAAGVLHISAETGRTQLKSIFHKTGSHNQSELMRMVTELSQLH